MPKKLGELYTSVLCAWDFRAVCAVRLSVGFKPAASAGSHVSVVTDVKSSAEVVVDVPIDDDITGEEIAARPSNLQT